MKTKLFILTIAFLLTIFFTFLAIKPYSTVKASLSHKTQEDPVEPLAPVMVTNTADNGAGSLRAAIAVANQSTNTTIQFNIPNTDPNFNGKVFIIRVNTALPVISQATTVIDGTTQTMATGDTNTVGPEIVLDGSLAPNGSDGIRITASNCVVRSLNIRNFFSGDGIQFSNASRSNAVTNCYIGTDENGTAMAGNQTGIRILDASANNTIGGTQATGNVISGNITDGIVISGSGSDNNLVAGNVIGVDASNGRNQLPNLNDGLRIAASAKSNNIGLGTADTGNIIAGNLGNGITLTGTTTNNNKVAGNFIGVLSNNAARSNGQSGVFITDSADTNTIGPSNVIAFNSRNGITVGATAISNAVVRNKITRNSIFMNVGLGIDLGNDGVTANDPGDPDNGPNNLINAPVITSVTNTGNSITVSGTVDLPSGAISGTVVEIFTNTLPVPGSDPSGFGEGQTFVAAPSINATGAFTANFVAAPNAVISALTVDATGNTSEFGANFQLGGGQADLIVTGLTLTPTTVNAGDTVRVTFTIRNQGTSSAGANRQDIVLSTDANITAQDPVLTSVTTNTLAPQATMVFNQNVTVPISTGSGQFFIGVITDAANGITESNETNNTANAPITVNSMPDLRVSNFRVSPASTTPGDTVRLDFTVSNLGSASAAAHVEEIRLSTDPILGNNDDVLIRTEQTSVLMPNDSSRLSIDIRIPTNISPGSYLLGVIADARNIVTESDETNNTSSMSITVSGSLDIEIANLSLTPSTGASATQVAVSFQLINRGSLNSPSVQVEVRFSPDQNITNADALLASLNSNTISAGQTATLNATVTIPAGTAPGRFFIGVVADPRDTINETNESNNTTTSTFTIADNASPMVRVISPNGNEVVAAGTTFTIQWTATDDVAVVSQDIFLSTDGGANFSQVITTGLPGTANSFVWNVPSSLSSGTARIQVVSRDGVSNIGRDNSDNDFIVGVRPVILGPKFQNGKLTFLVSGSNLPTTGSTLTVVNGASRETFALGLTPDSSKFLVKKKSTSIPTGISLNTAIPAGVPVMLIVTNPSGIASLPITFQR
ncbi:MAG: hypothetical protein HY819_02645 [Acidobacteria bacterium]|nr:hypothetical protein [Acidobacteriota bacterium]